ncbi:MAG: hypothetical protein ACN4GM_11630 [Gammaproteobacteria bacterium]
MDRQSVQSYVDQTNHAELTHGEDKRKYPRYNNVSFYIHIKLSNGEIVYGLAKNISRGGICIEYDSSAEIVAKFEKMFSVAIRENVE